MKATEGKSAEDKALIHRIDLNRRIIRKEGDRLRKDGIRVSEHIRILEHQLHRLRAGTGVVLAIYRATTTSSDPDIDGTEVIAYEQEDEVK